MNKVLIAVYGTLKEGEPNYPHYLENSKKLSNTNIKGKLFQFLNRSYPVIIESNSTVTDCEIYEVDTDTLLALNRMEGGAGYRLGVQHIKVDNKNNPVFYFYMSNNDKYTQEQHGEKFIPIDNYSHKTVKETQNAYVDKK